MKNYEKYNIDSLGINRCDHMYKKIFEKKCGCDGLECVDCPLESLEKFYKWSQEEYVGPIQLSHDEYVILKNLPSESKYIVRDGLGDLETWDFKPIRGNGIWTTDYESYFIPLTAFSHLFQFIKWEDEEPYEIAKLIEDYEKEHEDDN